MEEDINAEEQSEALIESLLANSPVEDFDGAVLVRVSCPVPISSLIKFCDVQCARHCNERAKTGYQSRRHGMPDEDSR